VWVVRFRLDQEEPVRLLAQRGDYTESRYLAVPDEPEAVSDEWLERFSRDAAERGTEPLEVRYARVRARARAQGIDTHRQDAQIEKRVRALERRLSDEEAA
jgi:hypothetical protein